MLYSDPQVPIVNAGEKYLTGMNLAWLSVTQISAAIGQCRDITNTIDIAFAAPVTVDISVNGVNGLDVGTVADSTFYAVWVIADSSKYKAPALQFSLSYANPTLPFGYDTVRYIGSVLTDSSGNILKFWQYNSGKDRAMYYDINIAAPTTSAATSYAPISLATSIPPITAQAIMLVQYTANSATNKAEFLPYGSTATNGIVQFGYGVAAEQQGMLTIQTQLHTGAPTFQFKTTSASDTLVMSTAGYIDQL